MLNPFQNTSLQKLRRWAAEEERDQTADRLHEEQEDSILRRLAQRHYEYLQKSERWQAESIDWRAEAKELLERVEEMTDPKEL